MEIHDNILHSPPITDIPDVSIGQYLFDKLRMNRDSILQMDADTGKCLTYRDVLEKSIILSTALRNYGFNVEDRISIVSENHSNYIIAMCSTLFIGTTFSPLNPSYVEREYRHMLEIYQPRLIFVSRRTEAIIDKIAKTLSWTVKLIELDDEALNENIITLKEIFQKYTNTSNLRTFVPTHIDDNRKRTAATLCSSGTTGLPKGVMLSHRNCISFMQCASSPPILPLYYGDRLLIFLPMFHGYAFGMSCLTIHSGASYVLMKRFDLETLMEVTEKYRITLLPLVPPILVSLVKHPGLGNYDFSSVREIMCGAAPLPKDVADEVKRITKIKYIRNGYGMTELTIMSHLSDGTSSDNTVGRMVPGFKCKIVDVETGEILGPQKVGEVCFKGDSVMLGYFNNPKATAETIDKENWLHSGDLGYYSEEGLLYITGRIKELIKYKGYQISPSEIESLLLTHPSVRDAAVIGKPDEIAGEVPLAFIVKQPNTNISTKEIIDFANENLSPQKWLRGGVKFIESIPKTPSGKIMRRDLQREF